MTSFLFGIGRIRRSRFKCNYLKNEQHFINFSFIFCNINQILNILKKKLIALAHVFPKLKTVKDSVRSLSKKGRFRTSFDSQHSLWREIIWKISPFWIWEVLGMFVNTLTAHDKFPVRDCENLLLLIQMQLPQKWKLFWQ